MTIISTAEVLEIKEGLRLAYNEGDLDTFNQHNEAFLRGIGAKFAAQDEPFYTYKSSVTQTPSFKLVATKSHEIEGIYAKARESQEIWGKLPIKTRQRFFSLIKDEMQKYVEHFKVAVSVDMGKSVQSSGTELVKAIEWLDWACSDSVRNALLQVTNRKTRSPLDITKPIPFDTPIDIETRKPLGVISSMTSANYPLGLFMGPLVSALVTGSSFIYKAGETTPSCSYLVKKALTDALFELRKEIILDPKLKKTFGDGVVSNDEAFGKFADGLFGLVQGREKGVAEKLVADSDEFIFIGGGVGHLFHQWRKDAGRGERTILELGGIAPGIIMNTAFENQSAEEITNLCYKAQTDNSGQRCTRLTVLFLENGKASDEILSTLAKKYDNETSHGNPFDPSVQYGPMIYSNGDEEMNKVIARAKELGAEIHGGGRVKHNDGFPDSCLVKAALVVWPAEKLNDPEVKKLVAETELFCPLTHVFKINELDQAIDFSKDLKYRLAASIFTNNGEDVAKLSEANLFGEFSVNLPPKDLSPISGHGGAPKESGRGRLGGIASLTELTESGQSVNFTDANLAKETIRQQTGIELVR